MPVTKTAKRALRGSQRKESLNKKLQTSLEVAIRKATSTKSEKTVNEAVSFVDKAVKRKIIHKNRAGRIKSQLAKLLPTKKSTSQKKKR